MSRFAVRLPAIILLAGLCSAVTIPSRAAAEIGERQREILNVLAAQVKAWNEGDIDGYMEGYVRSDSLRFASGGNVTYGWENTMERYKDRYSSKRRMGTLSFSDLDVNLLSDDAALVFGKWDLKMRSEEPWGLFTLLMRKTGDGWRIVHDHTSSGE
jgi:ketosteroid isomerase-like protein